MASCSVVGSERGRRVPSVRASVTASFTAVVPLYNRKDLIGETVRALQAQHRAFDRLVVVDDGSTDGGPDTVAQDHPEVTLIRGPNRGVQHARNAGAALAPDDGWVVFCDSDDLLEPDFLESVAHSVAADPSLDVIYVNFTTFGPHARSEQDKFSQGPAGWWNGFERSGDRVLLHSPQSLARLLEFQPLFMTGLAVRKQFFDRVGGFDQSLRNWKSEDLEFTFRVLLEGRVACLTPVLARVRKHDGGDSIDTARTLLGEADVLGFVAARRPLSEPLRRQVLDSANTRRWEALDMAVSVDEPRWDLAAAAAARVNGPPPSLRQAAKYVLARYSSSRVCRAVIRAWWSRRKA